MELLGGLLAADAEPGRESGLSAAPGDRRPGHARLLGTRRILAIVLAGVAAVLLAMMATSGVRLFVVRTPSMGTAAPVGTLVVDEAVQMSQLRVGDVITYQPPVSGVAPYTHRVVALGNGVVETRGDLNGAADPWAIRRPQVIGRAIALIPGLGWLLRAIPILLPALAVLWVATSFLRSATLRSALRLMGTCFALAAVGSILHPLTGAMVLPAGASDGGRTVTAVSTGLLPVAIRAAHGSAPLAVLASGEVGTFRVPPGAGAVRFVTQLALDPAGSIVLGVCCCLPLLWVVLVGLPCERRP